MAACVRGSRQLLAGQWAHARSAVRAWRPLLGHTAGVAAAPGAVLPLRVLSTAVHQRTDGNRRTINPGLLALAATATATATAAAAAAATLLPLSEGEGEGEGDWGHGSRRGAWSQWTAWAEAAEDSQPAAPPSLGDQAWREVVNRCAQSVVAIHVNSPRSFTTESSGSSQATGFIVDKERGIILTNRHVVHEGPVVAEAILQNHEEVPLRALYRDPIHDFGFFQFDPSLVKHMELEEIPLRPENAKIGTDIRVIGNNAGEKLAFLSGTLARLDRKAPKTGVDADYNTFYYQAASSTSGGSSGSPVVDRTGAAVALNAAGKRFTSMSYYLPLDRVVRALRLVQDGAGAVPRGTVETVFEHMPYGELQRLGLSKAIEAKVRETEPDANGLLVVKQTVPGGAGSDQLQAGDVLLEMNQEPVCNFVQLESILDRFVGQRVTFKLSRGPMVRDVELDVTDLHAITPSSYLEIGGCVMTNISHHQAKEYSLPSGCGVYIAESGYMLKDASIPKGWVLTRIGDEAVSTIDDMQAVLSRKRHGEKVPIRCFPINSRNQEFSFVISIDRQWFPFARGERPTPLSEWESTVLSTDEPVETVKPGPATTQFAKGTNKAEQALAQSLAMVHCSCPYALDMVAAQNFLGTGLVIDAELGLVVVDRSTVPTNIGDISLTFASSVEVPASVKYIHPTRNLAIIQYDPKLLGETPIKAATFSEKDPVPGSKAALVGLVGNRRQGSRLQTRTGLLSISGAYPSKAPSMLSLNMDGLSLQGLTAGQQDGVIVDENCHVLAFHAAFGSQQLCLGVPAEHISDVLTSLQQGENPRIAALGARLEYMSLAEARHLGLDGEAARVVETNAAASSHGDRRVLIVVTPWSGTPAEHLLRSGDMVLEIDGKPVGSHLDVYRAVKGKETVKVTLIRNGKRMTIDLGVTCPADGSSAGTNRFVLWNGALLQTPPLLLPLLSGVPKDCVIVTSSFAGSPAQQSGLKRGLIITGVDGVPTRTLDEFVAVVRAKADGEAVRIQHRTMHDQAQVSTMKLSTQYFPTWDYTRDSEGNWGRTLVQGPPVSSDQAQAQEDK